MFASIVQMLLMLPSILISLSVHESAHGYVAYKLGDPTAKNLGRITLNPIKHFDLFGFVSMLIFRIGWANPVPINSRFFKNPKRDMAITAAAGPLSNLCLAAIMAVLMRLVAIPVVCITNEKLAQFSTNSSFSDQLTSDPTYTVLSMILLILYLGIMLNLNLMLFNLIPIPPFDGSRILFTFLPTDLYFKVMRYERFIMLGFILLLATGVVNLPLAQISGKIIDVLFLILGMPEEYVNIAMNTFLARF